MALWKDCIEYKKFWSLSHQAKFLRLTQKRFKFSFLLSSAKNTMGFVTEKFRRMLNYINTLKTTVLFGFNFYNLFLNYKFTREREAVNWKLLFVSMFMGGSIFAVWIAKWKSKLKSKVVFIVLIYMTMTVSNVKILKNSNI